MEADRDSQGNINSGGDSGWGSPESGIDSPPNEGMPSAGGGALAGPNRLNQMYTAGLRDPKATIQTKDLRDERMREDMYPLAKKPYYQKVFTVLSAMRPVGFVYEGVKQFQAARKAAKNAVENGEFSNYNDAWDHVSKLAANDRSIVESNVSGSEQIEEIPMA